MTSIRKDCIIMNYGKILYCDTANGIGCRTVLFVSGCRHHCKECFNSETWNFNFGQTFTPEIADKIVTSLSPAYIDGISILGGEPFEPENQPEILNLILQIRKTHPTKTIWMYSGYLWEELTGQKESICFTDKTLEILKNIDILVDGEYQLDKRNIMLEFRGSENQRIIDVPQSIQNIKNPPVLSKYM